MMVRRSHAIAPSHHESCYSAFASHLNVLAYLGVDLNAGQSTCRTMSEVQQCAHRHQSGLH